MDVAYTVFIFVNKPVHEVFEAVADPAQLSSYFTTGGASARLISNQTVTWDFADFPGAFPVHVGEVVPDKKIAFHWKTNEPDKDYELDVTIRFSAVGKDRTRVEVEESGWHDSEAARKASYLNCMGWSQMLCALKMWAEHKINLREGAYK